MGDPVSDGAAVAWRLLATLEGGSLFLAASALLAYAARAKLNTRSTQKQLNKLIVVTKANDKLGKKIRTHLELRGCNVESTSKSAESISSSPGSSGEVDALVVIGAAMYSDTLDAMARLVSDDIYCNLKLVESLSRRVRSGGRIVWVSAAPPYNNNETRVGGGAMYDDAVHAYDAVLQATLRHVATAANCEPIWIDRCVEANVTAERTIAALLGTYETSATGIQNFKKTVRTISGYIIRWTKTATRQCRPLLPNARRDATFK